MGVVGTNRHSAETVLCDSEHPLTSAASGTLVIVLPSHSSSLEAGHVCKAMTLGGKPIARKVACAIFYPEQVAQSLTASALSLSLLSLPWLS